jgi:glutathionyl-hydroquinone reductase
MSKATRCVLLQRHSGASAIDTVHAMCWVAAPCPQATRTLIVRYANLTKEKLKNNVRGYNN